VSGIHFAAITGAVLAACASLLVLRFLPRQIAQHGATRGSLDAAEDMAQLGMAGIPPAFADRADADRADEEATRPDAIRSEPARSEVTRAGVAGSRPSDP
jgi:hypothetical protein